MQKKAILVVSFGTSHNDTRALTIDAIEKDIQNAYPDFSCYRAWTSKMIMSKVLKRDGTKIMSVTEAMEAMLKDNITDIIIQPTHVINGIENDLMIEDANKYHHQFSSITFGSPLLSNEEDNAYVIKTIAHAFGNLGKHEALVLMGHGTTHFANTTYAALDYRFKDMGYDYIHLGTVESYPSLDSLMRQLKLQDRTKLILTPFMIVAGDHAKNDLSGEDKDSWRSQFEAAGFEVECLIKGLGEYPEIRRLFIKHIEDAIGSSPL